MTSPDSRPPEPVIESRICTACFGHGKAPAYDMARSKYGLELVRCFRCLGAGVVKVMVPR